MASGCCAVAKMVSNEAVQGHFNYQCVPCAIQSATLLCNSAMLYVTALGVKQQASEQAVLVTLLIRVEAC